MPHSFLISSQISIKTGRHFHFKIFAHAAGPLFFGSTGILEYLANSTACHLSKLTDSG